MKAASHSRHTKGPRRSATTAVVGRSAGSHDLHPGLTVIVPAFNEAESIADTIRSLQSQTRPPQEILVVDDCSSDDTAAVAAAADSKVLTPLVDTVAKAGAQAFALPQLETEPAI